MIFEGCRGVGRRGGGGSERGFWSGGGEGGDIIYMGIILDEHLP